MAISTRKTHRSCTLARPLSKRRDGHHKKAHFRKGFCLCSSTSQRKTMSTPQGLAVPGAVLGANVNVLNRGLVGPLMCRTRIAHGDGVDGGLPKPTRDYA